MTSDCYWLHVAALLLMDSSATETDDESPPDNPVHVGRRKKKRESSDDASVGTAKKRLKRNHKTESPKKKAQLKTRTVYSDTKVCCRRHLCLLGRDSSPPLTLRP